MKSFARYLGNDTQIKDISENMCVDFLYNSRTEITQAWLLNYSVLLGFFQWTVARGYIDKIPLPKNKPQAPPNIIPYIYSDEEIKRIFDAALIFAPERTKTDAITIRMILVLTYTLGLRISEALAIRIKHLNFDENYVVIEESKFYKTRLLPFNNQIGKEIVKYQQWKTNQNYPQEENNHFFLDKLGMPVLLDTFQEYWRKICAKADIYRNDGATYQPRIHDLRHTFAVNRVVQWYKNGDPVQDMLPFLSTYLGHTYLQHTSIYLSMTDELLQQANNSFSNYINDKNHE
ncbi:tyrosine-type recombinase/integrase [Alistipes sp. OttesenSCG-928-L06]|nr:tyrosine-type recombinase/integrase [Alistipes sp. OttesenSCG-928-L06]